MEPRAAVSGSRKPAFLFLNQLDTARARHNGAPAIFSVWAAFAFFLVIMRLLARWQNMADPTRPTVPLLGTQIGRVLGYAIVFPTSVAGALFCVADGVSGWLSTIRAGQHVAYRQSVTLVIFLSFLLALAFFGRSSFFPTWQVWLIVSYSGVLAVKDLIHAYWKPRFSRLRQT